MEIVKLPRHQSAPAEADCIAIDSLPGGRVNLSGTALCQGDSVTMMGTEYATYADAEDQGLAWADAQGVQRLYITTDAPTAGD